jgi:hypothetical protein
MVSVQENEREPMVVGDVYSMFLHLKWFQGLESASLFFPLCVLVTSVHKAHHTIKRLELKEVKEIILWINRTKESTNNFNSNKQQTQERRISPMVNKFDQIRPPRTEILRVMV